MIQKYYVYGLFDPRNSNLRYVGYTKNSIKERLAAHCKDSSLKINNHKNNWIKLLMLNNSIPEIFILETYDSKEEALQSEIDLIAYYKYIGCSLTNVTKGGEDGTHILTIDSKEKISKSSKGRKHTQKTKEKISKTLTGIKRIHSPEHRAKISKTLTGKPTGRKLTQETIDKLKLINTGKITTEENKIKQVSNNKSYKLNEEKRIKIREMYATKNFSMKKIGIVFGISVSHVRRVIKNITGKYLK